METFLIRVWRQPGDTPDRRLCGIVERVGAHEAHPFQDEAELLALLRSPPSGHVRGAISGGGAVAPVAESREPRR